MKFPSTITEFYPCNQDEAAYPFYYGFMNSMGNWYIMKFEADKSQTYASGVSDYATNWTNRAALTYDYPY